MSSKRKLRQQRRPSRSSPVPRQRPARRAASWLPAVATVGILVLLVLVFLLVRYVTTPSTPSAGTQSQQQVIAAITGFPSSTLDSAGAGSATNRLMPISNASPLTGPNGKPELFYMGAEWCPYCAAERWPLIIALSRFGSFSGLATTTSSSTDVNPNTPTFTFRKATYSSQYLDFVAVETQDRDGKPLQSLSPEQQGLVDKYDAPPYSTSTGSIPFVLFPNRYALSGATYLPDIIDGMSWQQVADSLRKTGSPQARAILGSANLLTAAICQTTGQQPADVCSSATVRSLEGSLGSRSAG